MISSNGKAMMSKCAICSSKKSRFIKNQEAKGPLSKLGIKTPLSKLPVLGDILNVYVCYIYKNELDKACFQHHMAYGDFKDIKRRTASHRILRDKAFNITKNPKYDGYQRGLASMVYKFFDKNSAGNNNNDSKQNRRPLDLAALQLAKELHKAIIRKFKKRKVYSRFKDNIWSTDLADMQLIRKFNK